MITQWSSFNVLVVGAGGIGCELLKNLCLMEFGRIEIVDLDTIDVSNLNRQFLFQREHIGQSKAKIAKAALEKICPKTTIVAHHGNIKDKNSFPLQWFSQFDLIFNALDNLEARSYVNSICVLLEDKNCKGYGKILIESGTEGYEGQVTVIQRGHYECFQCLPKPTQKLTYPVCTIRSTPSLLIHCIVWAKDYLFYNIFCDSSFPESKFNNSIETVPHIEEKSHSTLAADIDDSFFKSIRNDLFLEDTSISNIVQSLFQKLFVDDVNRLHSLKDVWNSNGRKPPSLLGINENDILEVFASIGLSDSYSSTISDSVASYLPVFAQSCSRLLLEARKMFKEPLNPNTEMESFITYSKFDKDNEDMLHFIFSAASLRSIIFGIPREDIFKVKAKAGNIIPAIATTNAIIAGLMVVEAVKAVHHRLDQDGKTVFYTPSRYFSSESLNHPNPLCGVCTQRIFRVSVNTKCSLLQSLTDYLFSTNDGSLFDGTRLIFDPDFASFSTCILSDIGIIHESILQVVYDDNENFMSTVVILNHDESQQSPKFDIVFEGKRILNKKRESEDNNNDILYSDEKQKRIKTNYESSPIYKFCTDFDDGYNLAVAEEIL